MALEFWQYMNPESVLMRKQEEAARKERNCGDCLNKCAQDFKGETWFFCQYKRRQYGSRCELYARAK